MAICPHPNVLAFSASNPRDSQVWRCLICGTTGIHGRPKVVSPEAQTCVHGFPVGNCPVCEGADP